MKNNEIETDITKEYSTPKQMVTKIIFKYGYFPERNAYQYKMNFLQKRALNYIAEEYDASIRMYNYQIDKDYKNEINIYDLIEMLYYIRSDDEYQDIKTNTSYLENGIQKVEMVVERPLTSTKTIATITESEIKVDDFIIVEPLNISTYFNKNEINGYSANIYNKMDYFSVKSDKSIDVYSEYDIYYNINILNSEVTLIIRYKDGFTQDATGMVSNFYSEKLK